VEVGEEVDTERYVSPEELVSMLTPYEDYSKLEKAGKLLNKTEFQMQAIKGYLTPEFPEFEIEEEVMQVIVPQCPPDLFSHIQNCLAGIKAWETSTNTNNLSTD